MLTQATLNTFPLIGLPIGLLVAHSILKMAHLKRVPSEELSARPSLLRHFFWIPVAIHWLVVFLPIVAVYVISHDELFGKVGAAIYLIGALVKFFSTCIFPGPKVLFRKLSMFRQPDAKGMKKKVAVIGAGPNGLVAMKELADEGHNVDCYDSAPKVGGEFANGFWPGGMLTSSPYVTAFSDLEPSKCQATGKDKLNHLSKDDYAEYLQQYCDYFGLSDSLKLNERVIEVTNDVDGMFYVTTKDATQKTRKDGPFHHIAVASGVHTQPDMFDIPGRSTFKGKVMHTSDFAGKTTTEEAFGNCSGKRILTVGMGESTADIINLVNMLENPPKHCAASIRRGTFVIPRINSLNGMNNDFDSTRLRYALPKWVHNITLVFCTYLTNIFAKDFCAEREVRFNLFRNIPRLLPAYTTSTKSDNFVKWVASGKCELKPQIAKIDGSNVHFLDGSYMENVDVIIFGSGFKPPTYPFLDTLSTKLSCYCASERFLRMFDPNTGSAIAFIGQGNRPLVGSIPTVGEMQARLFALVVSGKRVLPKLATMESRIEQDLVKSRKEFSAMNQKWRALINWMPYMDTIASEIGCLPNASMVVSAPRLWFKILVGPPTNFHYRLNGPHAKPDQAAAVIHKLPVGTRKRDLAFFFAIHLTVDLVSWPVFFIAGMGSFLLGK